MSHLTPELVETLASGGAAPEASAHLAGCEACRTQVSDARGRQKLLKGLTPYVLSDMAFRRVEARLSEQVEEGLPSSGWRWLWWLMPAAAVAALVAFIVVRLPGMEPAPRFPAPPMELARAPFTPLTVVLASADAKARNADGSWRALAAGEVLEAGTALSGKRVVLAPDSELSWAFEVSGSVSLGGQATVALGAGTLAVQVSGAPAPVEIVAGPRRFIASDAAFLVSRAAAEVVLQVSRGEVGLMDSSSARGSAPAKFSAPSSLRWADGTAAADGRMEPPGEVHPALSPGRPWAGLDLSGIPAGATIGLDGEVLGVTPLSVIWQVGRHRLEVTPEGEATREEWIELIGGKPNQVTWPPKTATAMVPEKEADPEALRLMMNDLRRQRPKLAVCYEKWLKANPTASGTVELMLSISAEGVVRGAEVKGDPISRESAECLVRTAKTLILPSLGADQAVVVPLVLTPRAR